MKVKIISKIGFVEGPKIGEPSNGPFQNGLHTRQSSYWGKVKIGYEPR
jgi:hypothetical protein